MLNTLQKTNMSLEEMVPDTRTPGHDPRYWCLPPMRDDHDAVVVRGPGVYEFYLVTQGRSIGVWRNWTVAQSMVTGYTNAAYKGHRSYKDCVTEWQTHCQLGAHPHPLDPQYNAEPVVAAAEHGGSSKGAKSGKEKWMEPGASTASDTSTSSISTSSAASTTRSTTRRPRRSSSNPATVDSSGLGQAMVQGQGHRFYAIWNGGMVYSTKYVARMAFNDALEAGSEPELLSTDSFDVALGYAEGEL